MIWNFFICSLFQMKLLSSLKMLMVALSKILKYLLRLNCIWCYFDWMKMVPSCEKYAIKSFVFIISISKNSILEGSSKFMPLYHWNSMFEICFNAWLCVLKNSMSDDFLQMSLVVKILVSRCFEAYEQ